MSYAVSSPVIEGAVPVDEHMEVCEDGSPEYAPGGIALGTAPAELAQPKEAGLELQHPKAEARRTDDDGIEADAADIDPVPESPEYVLKQGSLDGSSSAHLDPVHTSARNADFHDPRTCCLQGGITRPASLMDFLLKSPCSSTYQASTGPLLLSYLRRALTSLPACSGYDVRFLLCADGLLLL